MSSLNRLLYFNCVVETGSISEASRIFDIQPSSISRQLAVLEQELGVRLLNKTTRNTGLTEAGHKYYEYSQRIVSEFDEAKRAINDLQEKPKGKLKISMTVGFGESVVLPLVSKFMSLHPDIDVKLELTERVVDLVEENIDVAIRSGRLPDSTMIAKRLAFNNFILCASPQYLAKKGTPHRPEDLIEHQCIRYSYSRWKDWFLMAEERTKITINNAISVNSVNGQKQLVINDTGLALMPYWAVKNELAEGSIIRVMPEHTFSPYEKLTATYAIYLKRDLISPKTRVFLDFLAENIVGLDIE
ncbi:LysR family transcriptional regulator [Parashewanella spongiae]|uniref:LysR family transcriptional regulator n=1 Tax=Parashewanella spongiae TaxID=342950 RepID=A0A3A6TYP9_9GAMM|nr:LysR family transcriptional regulator [Parashewanella spongiae]MCL1077959.1 LysR substrate-binding domain-containing protein [Parashewanella spongiae]RJY16916.1 LysR family transcriptional regulator [Parashewanella spongiae]